MDRENGEKIETLLPDLIELTDCSTKFVAELRSRKVIHSADEAHLVPIANRHDKNNEMYRIIMTRANWYQHLVDCLKATGQTGALKLLGDPYDAENVGQEDERCTPVCFNTMPPCDLFTGRKPELKILQQQMVTEGSKVIISQNSSITGLGGIGKSELAKTFIANLIHPDEINYHFKYVIWINAESDTTAAKDFKTLASDKLSLSTMNANGVEKEITSIIEDVYENLGKHKTLITFDNAENTEHMQKYLPSQPRHRSQIAVLITSQDSHWNIGTQICLSGMEEADAIELVQKGLKMCQDENEEITDQIQSLVTRLQYFPLAITQAIAYINIRRKVRQNYGPAEYLEELEVNTKTMLSRKAHGNLTPYQKTAYEVMEVALNKILSNDEDEECKIANIAINLVKLMAYMAPDNISDTIFRDAVKKQELDDALLLLQRYNIITFSPPEEGKPLLINIHRLVQDVLRILMQSEENDTQILLQGLELFDKNMDTTSIDHAVTFWSFAAKDGCLVKTFCEFPLKIPQFMIKEARINDALIFAKKELDRFKKIITYEEDAQFLVYLEVVVGNMMLLQSKFSDCKIHFQNVFQNALKYLPDTNSTMLQLRFNIAQTLYHLSDFQQALEEYNGIYDSWKIRLDGKENLHSLTILLRLGMTQRSLRKYEDTVTTFNKVIEKIEETKNPSHYELTLNARCYLAITQGDLGNLEGAVTGLENVLKEAKERLPENHRQLPVISNNLAVFLFWTGRFEESLEISKCSYENCKSVYGPDNDLTLRVKGNVLACMSELGKLDEALEMALEVYNVYLKEFGENGYHTVSAAASVGKILSQMDKHQDALIWLSKSLKTVAYTDSASTLEILLMKFHVAKCLVRSGESDEGREYLESMKPEILSNMSNLFFVKECLMKLYEEVTSSV